MGKSTKTYEERIQEKDLRIEKLAQKLKRYEAQKKQLEKRKKEEERKIFLQSNAEKSGYGHEKRRMLGVRSFLIPFFYL